MKVYVTKNEWQEKSPRIFSESTTQLHAEERWLLITQKIKATRLGMIVFSGVEL